MTRRLHRQQHYDLYHTPGNRRLCCIIHGLGGEKGTAYWSGLAQLLRYDPDLANTDICFWEYASSRSPIANLLALARRGRGISTIPEVARTLDTFINDIAGQFGYDEVLLAGHSLGGAVAILAAEHQVEAVGTCKVSHVCFMATPQSPPRSARAAARIFRWNPHIRWLASNAVTTTMGVSLRNMRLSGIHATYVHYTLDELLPLSEDVEFDRREACEGIHGWPGQMNDARNSAYRVLVQWIKKPKGL
jgi:pimeloyl-ACP methyl ester carboxylesterase